MAELVAELLVSVEVVADVGAVGNVDVEDALVDVDAGAEEEDEVGMSVMLK